MTKEDMERWHLALAQAAGLLSLALSRRRRPPDLASMILDRLEPVMGELAEEESDAS